MALANPVKEEQKKITENPSLYTIYGKEYKYSDLEEAADRGLSEYLATLKRGSKDEALFREAYRNMMGGIKDGSIVYKDGRFVDSKGRGSIGWKNNNNRDKDYYGLVANYIYGKMGGGTPYSKSEETNGKIAWDGGKGVTTALLKRLYNSDKENLQDFIEIDKFDETTKSRPTASRAQELSGAYQYLLDNWDNLFTGYENSDKETYQGYLKSGIEALKDNTIDAGDYLALSRISDKLNYRGMFTDQQALTNPSQEGDYTRGGYTPQSEFQKFVDWASTEFPIYSGRLRNYNLNTNELYAADAVTALHEALKTLSDEDLRRIIKSSLYDRNYSIMGENAVRNAIPEGSTIRGYDNNLGISQALKVLKGRGVLNPMGQDNPEDNNLYYIGVDSDNYTGWIWDDVNNSIQERRYYEIPYWRDKILNKYRASNGGNASDTYQYLYSIYQNLKEGGVIKALTGTTLMNRHSGRGPIAEDLNQYLALENTLANAQNKNKWNGYYNISKMISDLKGMKGDDKVWRFAGYRKNPDGSFITNPTYKMEGDSSMGTAKSVIDNPDNIYGLTNEQLIEHLNQLEELGKGLSWDLSNDDYTKQDYSAWNDRFDQTGFNYFFGGDSNRFSKMGPSTFNRHALYEELKKDPEALKWVKFNNESGKWELNPPGELDENGFPKVSDITANSAATVGTKDPVTGKVKVPELAPMAGKSTDINLTENNPSKPSDWKAKAFGILQDYMPEIMAASRLPLSIHTNNRVAKTIRPTLRAVLQDTYELQSPITGKLGEMQARNQQGADVRRIGRNTAASNSDATLGASAELAAGVQATNLEHQGFLADDAEIVRTQGEALKRQEDNVARRSAIANANRAAINASAREMAQLEATRLNRNWQSIDNYLKGVEDTTRKKIAYKQYLQQQAAESALNTTYSDTVSKFDQAYRQKHPDATASSILADPNYTNTLQALQRQYGYESYRLNSGLGGITNPYKDYEPVDFAEILRRAKYRKGGKIQPSAIDLINKVIYDENNT